MIYNNTVTPENVISADASNVIVKANAAYADKNAATGKAIAITYTLTGSAAGNYLAPANDNSKTADITPLTLTVGSIVTASRTKDYDGSSKGQLSIGISCLTYSLLFNNDVNTEHTLVISTVSKYYTDSSCTSETSQPGTNLGINYTISLSGAAAGNYVFDNNTQSISGKTDGGTINAMPLTINTDFIQTEKTYDGTTRVYSNDATPVEINDYSVDSSKIGGLVNGETVEVKAAATYADGNAGENKTINLTYVLSGDHASHYTLTANDSINTGKINPIQLTYDTTPFTTNGGSKTYDGMTIVRYNGTFYDNYNKNSGGTELKNCVTGILDADKDYITVKATATFADKNAGENKPVTFGYSLEGSSAGNYLAPVTNSTSGLTAKISPKTLSYSNPSVEFYKKYQAGDTSAYINNAGFDQTQVVKSDGSNYDDVALASVIANYCSLADGVTPVPTDSQANHDIYLTGSLTGADAGNYRMENWHTAGRILPVNAVISANSFGGTWTSWTYSGFGALEVLNPPTADFRLIHYDGSYYGIGSDGKIYCAADAASLSWSVYTKADIYNGESLSDYQVFGIDYMGAPLAIASDGSIYSFDVGSGWTLAGFVTLYGVTPIDPSYYSYGTNEFLIYQDSNGNIYQANFDDSTPVSIASSPTPLTDFSNEFIYFNGSFVRIFAY
jgi:hypothetical protein